VVLTKGIGIQGVPRDKDAQMKQRGHEGKRLDADPDSITRGDHARHDARPRHRSQGGIRRPGIRIGALLRGEDSATLGSVGFAVDQAVGGKGRRLLLSRRPCDQHMIASTEDERHGMEKVRALMLVGQVGRRPEISEDRLQGLEARPAAAAVSPSARYEPGSNVRETAAWPRFHFQGA